MKLPVARPPEQRPSSTRLTRLVTLALSTATLGLLASCASLSGEARDEFARAASCPPDRITVVSRPGPGAVPEESPPADVAAHPERLAFWRQQREAMIQDVFGGCEWFEASGCGRHEILCCEHPPANTERSSRAARAAYRNPRLDLTARRRARRFGRQQRTRRRVPALPRPQRRPVTRGSHHLSGRRHDDKRV
jgi:hypothetical protein